MASTSRMILLKSSDGVTIEVEEGVALQSQVIKGMIEDDCADGVIPILNVTSKILSMVMRYCEMDLQKPTYWDTGFVSGGRNPLFILLFDPNVLFDLLLAARYLDIKSLLDLTTQTVADMIKGKTPEEIRKTFNINNDFGPEEEDEVRRENEWAFD